MTGTGRPDLLYVVHRVPYPPDKGDRIRSYHLLRRLSRQARVHLACLADEPVPADTLEALKPHCERISITPIGTTRWLGALASLVGGRTVTEGAFRSRGLRWVIRQWANGTRFDGVLASTSGLAGYLRTPELKGVPAVVDLVDVDSQKWLDYAAASRGPAAWLYRAEGRRLRRLESYLASWTRALTLVSDAEVSLFRRFCGDGRVESVTNGVDLEYFAPRDEANEAGCVFVGALDYKPNADAACWFCREVWPQVRAQRPNETIRLVGRQPTAAVRRLAELPGVEVVGQVADVRPYVARAAVVVVPLRIARGVQNKLLEALAMGKATVASSPTRAGVPFVPGEQALVADEPHEWTESVLKLLEDPLLRRRLGNAGRAYVEEHHRWETCLEPFGKLLDLVPENSIAPSQSERECHVMRERG